MAKSDTGTTAPKCESCGSTPRLVFACVGFDSIYHCGECGALYERGWRKGERWTIPGKTNTKPPFPAAKPKENEA